MSGPLDALDVLVAAGDDGRLSAICHRRQVRLLGVFGSAVRRAPDASDLDVCASFDGPPDVLGLLDDLIALTGFDAIDLAVLDGADPVLRAEALTGLGLHESVPGRWAESQMAAIGERWDTAWLRRLDLEAMAE